MARAKLKAEERISDLLNQIYSDEPLDLWSFRDLEAEFGKLQTSLNKAVMGLAYVAKGDVNLGLTLLKELIPHGDAMFARIYCRLLERFSRLDELDEIIYSLADKYQTKWFCYKAGGIAYLVGRLSKCSEYLEKHYKMLSAEEQRDTAENFRQEAVDDMDAAYKASGCTAEQYRQVGLAVSRVLAAFPPAKYRTNISGASGGSYLVEILDATPEQVSIMNMKLADEICSVDLLDNCNLIARFSVERPLAKGIDYAYN